MADGASSLRERALRLLAQRDHARAELARKLGGHGTHDEVDAVIDRMAELGLQSDARFAEAWVRTKSARHGAARIRRDLAQRGVARELIDAALASECGEEEIDRARAVWARKFGHPPGDHREWARQARFLQGRGFSGDVIARLLKEVPDESA
ncbi:MAG: recombination regulator RecX [Rhodocyclaceae bacterium]